MVIIVICTNLANELGPHPVEYVAILGLFYIYRWNYTN